MRVYLDNCCYNRPYDDQKQLRISLETQAKLRVQEMIKDDEIELASSYVLRYENSRNPYEIKRRTIGKFIEDHTSVYIDETHAAEVGTLAAEAMETGVKTADAHHAASAILAGCDYLLTTDDRLLKYSSECIKTPDPIELIMRKAGSYYE